MDVPPASYHSEPWAEACEQIPPRRQEQTGRNPFHVQKGEMESFGKQDFLVKMPTDGTNLNVREEALAKDDIFQLSANCLNHL